MTENGSGSIGRRGLIVTGAAAALTLGTVNFANAEPGASAGTGRPDETEVVRGTLPPGSPDFVYLPIEVPHGVRELAVSYSVREAAVPAGTQGNALDIGIFDERGTALGGAGFRGWSGGARTEFFIRADDATPGYLRGPVRAGTWHIALGPYTVAPQGLAVHGDDHAEVRRARHRRRRPSTRRRAPRGGAGPGTGATATCTRCTPTAAAPRTGSRRLPARRAWTSSTPRSTTRIRRTGRGRACGATTC